MAAPTIPTIPIKLSPITAPVGITAANFNELMVNICAYISASFQGNVSFFQTFSGPPGYFAGDLIYVTNLGYFMRWDTGSGSYIALNTFPLGTIAGYSSLFGATLVDDTLNGWVWLNGRMISALTGLSASQLAVLNALFPSGTLPDIQPLPVLPAGQQFILGSFTSGAFTDGETAMQATSSATAVIFGNQSSGTFLVVKGVTGTPDNSDIWTGGTSSAAFTPTALPVDYFGPYPVRQRIYVGTNIPSV